MWIMLSDAFLSIVASEFPDDLLVRARARGDIEKVFPRVDVEFTPKGDYHYRATIARQTVCDKIVTEIVNIDYPNFKNSVAEKDRHDAYLRCWGVMAAFQSEQGRKRRLRPQRRKVS